MADSKETNNKEDPYTIELNPEKQILSLKKEFDKILENINKEENTKENIYSINYNFLKDDYIELYDRKKLLNDPKYHLAKFRIKYSDYDLFQKNTNINNSMLVMHPYSARNLDNIYNKIDYKKLSNIFPEKNNLFNINKI